MEGVIATDDINLFELSNKLNIKRISKFHKSEYPGNRKDSKK